MEHGDTALGRDDDTTSETAARWLHHVAGLTAGRSLRLDPGRHQFGPSDTDEPGLSSGDPRSVSFELTVGPDGSVVLTPGTELLAVEGRPVDRPRPVAIGEVIQLLTDQFTITADGTYRPMPVPERPTEWEGLPASDRRGLRRLLGRRNRRSSGTSGSPHALDRVVEARRLAIHEARTSAATPAIVNALAAGDGAHFRGVSLASGDRAWSHPELERAGPVGADIDFLPAVPLEIDLRTQSLSIEGARPARLAVARHVIGAHLIVDPGSAIAEMPAGDEWRWAGSLVGVMAGSTGLRVVEADSATVVLTTGDRPLDEIDVAILIADDGTASARLGETRATGLVPHGITVEQIEWLVDRTITHRRRLITDQPADADLDLRSASPVIDLTDAESDRAVGAIEGSVERLDPVGIELFEGHRLLVIDHGRRSTVEILSSAALSRAHGHPARPFSVLDGGDRALIRLRQLPACRRYAAVDDVVRVSALVNDLEASIGESSEEWPRALLVCRDLLAVLDQLDRSGYAPLASRLERLLTVEGTVDVVASTDEHPAPSGPLARFAVRIDAPADFSTTPIVVADDERRRVLDLDAVAGRDMTGAVAGIAHRTEPIRNQT